MATKPTSISGSNYEEIINLGLDDKGYFVARQRDGTAVAYKLQAGTLKKTWDFASSVIRLSFARHTFSTFLENL